MRIYNREDGTDVWRDIETDEELQEELEQLEKNRGKLLDRVSEMDRLIARKKAEIVAVKQQPFAPDVPTI